MNDDLHTGGFWLKSTLTDAQVRVRRAELMALWLNDRISQAELLVRDILLSEYHAVWDDVKESDRQKMLLVAQNALNTGTNNDRKN